MNELFGDLRKLPCWYCKYYYSYNSKCSKRKIEKAEDGKLEICFDMEPDYEQIEMGIKAYFEYLQLTQSKKY